MKTNYCTAALASLTYAMKAQGVLSAAGFYTDIVKLDPARSKKGCAYGVQFNCDDSDKVRQVMKTSGISVSRYLRGGGDII
jgi:hypothetical protein